MKFSIPLGNFLNLVRRIQMPKMDGEKEEPPLMYFEEGEVIHLYQPYTYIVYHSLYKLGEPVIIPDTTVADEENFRLQYLEKGIPLTEKPKGVVVTINEV
jgi:hypothetical protein